MHVFLVRHADAVNETLVLRDPHRHLTTHGRTQARALGDRLRWHDCTPLHVWTSPLVRAVQTAELLVAGIGCETLIEVVMDLAPDGSPREVVAAIHALPPTDVIVLVGHEPALSAIGVLLTDDLAFRGLAKAQAVRVDHGRERWRFAWDAEAPELTK